MKIKYIGLGFLLVFLVGCNNSDLSLKESGEISDSSSNVEFVLAENVKWQPLNPARGDAGPRAGMLWGDITKDMASGFLVKFAEGFASPSHIHNITYRAVVITGTAHNDDKNAEKMWMGPGSFWTQPAGEAHITAEHGGNTMVFLEIQEGPYLVKPEEEAFDNGELPINLEERNVVWLDASGVTWIDTGSADDVKMSFLWGSPKQGEVSGSFIKLPAGYKGAIKNEGSDFRVVTIVGSLGHETIDSVENLKPGSYFGSTDVSTHSVVCSEESDCTLYVRTDDEFKVLSR